QTAYTYDKAGNRIQKLENGIPTEYTYNQLNQLVSETTQGKTINYAYDTNGNLLCKGTETEYDTYTYTKDNQLATATNHTPSGETTESYTYDAEGNRLKKTVTKKRYVVTEEESAQEGTNAETGVSANADEEVNTVTAESSADREKTVETVSETTTYYVMDNTTGYAQVLMELDENKEAKVLYTRGDGLISRQELKADGKTRTSLYHSDGHGDVRQLTDANGNVTDAYRYNSFGELKESTGNTENPYLYTGEYYDEGTGLYYLRARYMNPETGTFISMDTYRGNAYDPASLHRYTYAQNNPQMYNDPSGHFAMIGLCLNQASTAVLRNLNTIHVMGMVGAAVSGIVNSVINPNKNLGQSMLEGYAAGAGIAVAYIGMTAIVAAAGIMAAIEVAMFSAQVIDAALNVILAIAYGVTGNHLKALEHMSVAVLCILELYMDYGMSGTINVSGAKGEVTFGVKNSNTSRGVLSDHLGVPEGNSNGLFYSIKNKNGGEVYVSRDSICADDFAGIVSDANGKAKINIISGVHGNKLGEISVDKELFKFDKNNFESANVFNYADLDAKQLCDIINSPDITICGWCFSEYNPLVRMALSMK
uniref:RHS repeat domain-containing protein n=1 Tax=Acetatifactor sp. TaxID=1872090 RepID=UPI0040575B53